MIDTLPLFEDLGAGLVKLLSELSPDDWRKRTVHRDRDVKDLASHLLDTAQRRLAMQRDGWFAEGPDAGDWDSLVRFIQRTNREWMDVTRRLSPRQLVAQLARVEQELIELLRTLEPHGRAIFSVAWAGEDVSENWFDIAREYTERWHHQQQIRDAVGRPGFGEPRFLAPVIATFLRGAPHAYRDVDAEAGTAVAIGVDDEHVTVVRGDAGWRLGARQDPTATIALAGNDAWRLWTKGLSASDARARARTSGPEALVAPMFRYVAIMA
jgi:uncharacterized protein (TIGR03083 family)